MADDKFEPKIVAFLCKWCSSAGSDLAGVSRMQYPPNVVPIQVMCSGSVSPLYIFNAFKKGADGVLVSGCHPGDCHYIKGNYYARRRIALVKEMLEYIDVTEGKFWDVIDEARSPHLWEEHEGEWRLKHAVWMEGA